MVLEGTTQIKFYKLSGARLYVPEKVASDSAFPFTDAETVVLRVDVENQRLIIEKAREWWEAEFGLDWSTMETTFKKLTPELQEKILKGGYWSKGPGNFVETK